MLAHSQASSALDRCQSSQISLRVQLLHQLAQCEVEEELFTAAQATIRKALETDCTGPPDTLHNNDPSVGQLAHSGTANPLAASCIAESDSSQTEAVGLVSRPLSWCLDQMRGRINSLALMSEPCNPVEQLQQVAFRVKNERTITKLVESAEGLRIRALQQLAEEESRHGSRQARVERQPTGKRGLCSVQQSRTSVVQKELLSWKGENCIKSLITSFGSLLNRGLHVGDSAAAAKAATAILSMVHGTESFLGTTGLNLESCGVVQSVDLRIRLRPPFDSEVAVNIIEAAYALVSIG